ncbi:MAG TPA: CDP-glycerol glycerophosphotransferase family protein [Candidatus Magasanikbacteria bacterium]|nr:CDP-glycerol glycerophosphotransferase family protein [Candidatus Magasanikbacteria bacterium]
MKKVITLLNLILSWLIYGLSFLVPKDKRVWIFIGWHKNKEREIFADNSKYLFLYCYKYRQDKKIIWIGQDKKISKILDKEGLTSYPINSLRGIYYSLRANYTFVDALLNLKNWRYSGNSKIIQLWHGKGLKKSGFDSPYSIKKYNKLLFPNLFTKFFKTIATSKITAKLMSSTFKIDEKNVLITGLPRNDIFFIDLPGKNIDLNSDMENKVKNNDGEKILYAPTFRPDGSNPLDQWDFKKTDDLLREKNYYLFIQLHPKFAVKNYAVQKNLKNIFFVKPGYDFYPLLKNFNLLITDYSSLYIDFLLLDKPIIFFTYDLEKYSKEMGLHNDFIINSPGIHSKNFSELLMNLANFKKDPQRNRRLLIKSNLYEFDDGKASQRILEGLHI